MKRDNGTGRTQNQQPQTFPFRAGGCGSEVARATKETSDSAATMVTGLDMEMISVAFARQPLEQPEAELEGEGRWVLKFPRSVLILIPTERLFLECCLVRRRHGDGTRFIPKG